MRGIKHINPATFCGKVTFPDEKAAKRKIKEIEIQNMKIRRKYYHSTIEPARTYFCKNCGGWHLTSKA